MNKIRFAQIAANPSPPSPPSGQISISVEQILLGAAIVVGSATIGIVKWFVSRSIREYETKMSELEIKFEEIEGAMHNQQRTNDSRHEEIRREFLALQTRFVGKDDYLKHQTISEAKLDALHRRLDELMSIIIKK